MTSRNSFKAAAADLTSICEGLEIDIAAVTLNSIVPLLVAETALRTYEIATKAETLAAAHEKLVQSGNLVDETEYPHIPHDDMAMRVAETANDSPLLQQAHATWIGAQMVLNNEIMAINSRIQTPHFLANPHSLDVEGAKSFKKAALDLCMTAASLLKAVQLEAAAEKLEQEVHAYPVVSEYCLPSPSDIISQLAWDYRRGGTDLAITLSNKDYLEPDLRDAAYDSVQKILQAAEAKAAPSHPPALPVSPTPS